MASDFLLRSEDTCGSFEVTYVSTCEVIGYLWLGYYAADPLTIIYQLHVDSFWSLRCIHCRVTSPPERRKNGQHILSLVLVVFPTRMQVIPPDTIGSISIHASGILVTILNRIVKNASHIVERVVKHDSCLRGVRIDWNQENWYTYIFTLISELRQHVVQTIIIRCHHLGMALELFWQIVFFMHLRTAGWRRTVQKEELPNSARIDLFDEWSISTHKRGCKIRRLIAMREAVIYASIVSNGIRTVRWWTYSLIPIQNEATVLSAVHGAYAGLEA